eukprot:757013-Hanusia_phi.AAC.3
MPRMMGGYRVTVTVSDRAARGGGPGPARLRRGTRRISSPNSVLRYPVPGRDRTVRSRPRGLLGVSVAAGRPRAPGTVTAGRPQSERPGPASRGPGGAQPPRRRPRPRLPYWHCTVLDSRWHRLGPEAAARRAGRPPPGAARRVSGPGGSDRTVRSLGLGSGVLVPCTMYYYYDYGTVPGTR